MSEALAGVDEELKRKRAKTVENDTLPEIGML